MDLAAATEFVRDHHRAVLSTTRRDGSPQMSPVSVGLDAESRLLISTRLTAYKVGHVERDATVRLCVLPDDFFGPWVQITGTAEIVRLPTAMELLVDYYRDLAGEHPDWDDYRAAMVRDQRCIPRITPTAAGPDHSG
ncbi:PPOX class F420-dependent oxidoreductase [Candidatus Frankia alpina]|uniref:PPOX class F420-dependent oxidoreductase n=1 Tax=Candidatus Frankia alpina TaxID=2699483 RepID=A0A4S5EPH0_9ACTN|nr:PPOX class F420-dependent oxidoreductase [Candidatus Frankia alpina]THJ74126.1 PPOX class F420-dependent oxidoreductase [Candidatus Frankia alpina]